MNVQHLKELNQHPLNQSALRRLNQQGGASQKNLMHLLELAHLGALDDQGEPPDPQSVPGKVLADWGRPNSGRQAAALQQLEANLTPEWVDQANPDRISSLIVDTLKGASGLASA